MLGFYLPPFETSIRKRHTIKAKFYFFDTGIVRALQNLLDDELLDQTYAYGDLFETFLINEFIKLDAALLKRWQFSYFKTGENLEIDLLIEKPRGKRILVEIKSFSKIKEEKLKPFIAIQKEIPHETSYVLSNDKTE